ncbi:MAG TPA: hypothetical protein VMW85_00460 [Methanomassiliicoccales archaeon]|nr:hypothetical protein [Methanomassiliicoccales archaeon]
MKFCYCGQCKDLRPRSWYHHGDCLLCGNECAIIVVPMSIFGYLMYIFSAIGAIFVVLELINEDVGLGEGRLYIMFGSLVLAMVFTFLEQERSTKLAREKVGKVL